VVDVEGIEYFKTGRITPEHTFYTPLMNKMHAQYSSHRLVNTALPLIDLEHYLSRYFAHLEHQHPDEEWPSGFLFHSARVIPTLTKIEQQGIHVNASEFKEHFPYAHIHDSTVYTEYNPYTATGRITNRFDGVNYAALNSKDGTRSAITSRYPDGVLVNIDYKSFHPLLVATMIQVSVDHNRFYQEMAEQLYFTSNPTPDQIKGAKPFVMQLMYGEETLTGIPFFDILYQDRKRFWNTAQEQGFIMSKTNRKIHLDRIEEPSQSKLFNYMIQLREMETTIQLITKFIESQNVILYTYDSVLLDIPGDQLDAVKRDAEILTGQGNYPIRLYIGKNYGNMMEM
jgi:hypothetical protein